MKNLILEQNIEFSAHLRRNAWKRLSENFKIMFNITWLCKIIALVGFVLVQFLIHFISFIKFYFISHMSYYNAPFRATATNTHTNTHTFAPSPFRLQHCMRLRSQRSVWSLINDAHIHRANIVLLSYPFLCFWFSHSTRSCSAGAWQCSPLASSSR